MFSLMNAVIEDSLLRRLSVSLRSKKKHSPTDQYKKLSAGMAA
jgi:hypothetical protein